MRSRRSLLVLLALLAVAVVAIVVARGGEDGGGEEVTHAGLVTRSNAICARLARDNRALEPAPRPYDMQSLDFFAGVSENVTTAREALAELDPPADDAAALDELVDIYNEIDVAMDKIEAAASVEQDQEVVVVLSEIGDATARAVESERALGICPGDTSARASITAVMRRTRPNPLTETGTLFD